MPLYTVDGQLCDWISEQRAARLDQLGLIRVVRHKKGRVARCILFGRPGDGKPARLGDFMGTRYSFREHLESGRVIWALKPLRRPGEIGDSTAMDRRRGESDTISAGFTQ